MVGLDLRSSNDADALRIYGALKTVANLLSLGHRGRALVQGGYLEDVWLSQHSLNAEWLKIKRSGRAPQDGTRSQ